MKHYTYQGTLEITTTRRMRDDELQLILAHRVIDRDIVPGSVKCELCDLSTSSTSTEPSR